MDRTSTRYPATIDDFDELRAEKRAQLIAGRIIHDPAPAYRHQRVLMNLVLALGEEVRRAADGELLCAPIDVELGPHDVFQPEIVYISRERSAIITERRIVGAPDLVIDIISPSSAYLDRNIKRRVYERTGVCEYWIVEAAVEAVDVLVNGRAGFVGTRVTGDASIASPVLPGLAITVSSIFR